MKNKNLTTELHVQVFKSKASKTIMSGMVMPALTSTMAQHIVSGTFTGDDREALLDVSVMVTETARGTITDLDWGFQISASPDDRLRKMIKDLSPQKLDSY